MRRTGHPRRVAAVFAASWTVTWISLGSLSDWGAYWLAWIFAGFLVPELYGLITNTADTLSRNTWALEHLDFGHPLDFAEWSPLHYAIAVIVWLLFAWLSVHIPFGFLR
jgi:hypothetical protein